eukprot:TRINITY_DN307_c0_g1_i1.p1 TRINITY_DN307_c0_g1~~TRINITY_DN307_c0_g1_i1.p1  ORF type:complete len:653 (-),score=93.11 TRINITY_DN307_c0_g1_i1:191-2011(-)
MSDAQIGTASSFASPGLSLPLAPPFAKTALWASNIKGLRDCDDGIQGEGEDARCPVRPEHGGAGFLSSIFTWRYALNNVRAALIAQAGSPSASGLPSPPPGINEHTASLLHMLDVLMDRPNFDSFGELIRSLRQFFNTIQPFLEQLPPVAIQLPSASHAGRQYWTWPSDGRTALGAAVFNLQKGVAMPAVGFGTWRLWAKQAYQPVRWALEIGYRHIDTAEGYANEEVIGQALRDSGVPRQDVFIATKASSVPKGLTPLEHMLNVFEMQLNLLGTDYVDVYMLHTPPRDEEQLRIMWTVMEQIYQLGRARALGISNCDANDLKVVMSMARVPPTYIQNLFKVYKPGEQMPVDEDIVTLAQAHGITVVGYSVQTEWPHVLSPLEDPHVLAVASRVGRTPSQVLHRWALQRGIAVIPKSSSRERIAENAQLLDFQLDMSAMRVLDGLSTLSESGATQPMKPKHEEDVFGLAALAYPATVASPPVSASVAASQQSPYAEPAGGVTDAWGAAAAARPPAAVRSHHDVQQDTSTAGRGFPFASIRNFLLGAATDLPPDACRQRCQANPNCAAWEVCAPVDKAAGCEGCYLISQAPPQMIAVEGWHAAIERR